MRGYTDVSTGLSHHGAKRYTKKSAGLSNHGIKRYADKSTGLSNHQMKKSTGLSNHGMRRYYNKRTGLSSHASTRHTDRNMALSNHGMKQCIEKVRQTALWSGMPMNMRRYTNKMLWDCQTTAREGVYRKGVGLSNHGTRWHTKCQFGTVKPREEVPCWQKYGTVNPWYEVVYRQQMDKVWDYQTTIWNGMQITRLPNYMKRYTDKSKGLSNGCMTRHIGKSTWLSYHLVVGSCWVLDTWTLRTTVRAMCFEKKLNWTLRSASVSIPRTSSLHSFGE